MIRETIQKRMLCILLSVAVAVTTFCCNQEVVFASENTKEEESADSLEKESPEAEPMESGGVMPEQEVTKIPESEVSEAKTADAEALDITEQEDTEGNTANPEDGQLSNPEMVEQEISQDNTETAQDSEKETDQLQQDELESDGAAAPADHSLTAVYWNPKAESEMSPDGQTYMYGGNDNNTGASVRVPVQTLEKALLRAASDAVIYCMGYYGKYEDYSINGGFYNAVIKRYNGHNGNILQITNGTMRLSNLTLDGNEDSQAAVLAVTSGGELILGDSVGNVGNTMYLIESEGKIVRLAGRPERDTVYHLRFASGYFNHAVNDADSGLKEIMLVDASEAGLDPTSYFVIEDLPQGWEIYTKDNRQIWARRLEPYTAIYLNGISGNDSKSGRNARQAVKTYERAWELYQSQLHGTGTIYITGTVKVSDSLSIEQVRIARNGCSGALFQVENSGSFTIGNDVTIQDNPELEYAIKSSGNLKIAASSDVGGIFLSNRQKPLTLEGTGNVKFHITAGSDFQAGDLVVANARTNQAELSGYKYVLEQQGQNLHLGYPPCIYLDGRNGQDYFGGDIPEAGVKSLQRALDLAQASGKNKIMILGAPVQISNGDSVTIPDGMEITAYDNYGGDLINVTGGLLNVQGIVSSSALSSTAIVIKGTGRVIAGNGNVNIGGASVTGNGSLEIGDVGFDKGVSLAASGTVIQNGGTLHAGVFVRGGTYTLNDGNIIGADVSGSGVFNMNGGRLINDEGDALVVSSGGTAAINGGVLEEFRSHAIVIEGGDVTLRGGSIRGNGNDVKRSIKVDGKLHIAGDVEIENAIISLEKNTDPLLLETPLPAGRVYQIDVGYSYVAPGSSEVLVQGAVGTPATTDHFQLATDAVPELSIENNSGTYSVMITKTGDPEGIYLDGTHGNDVNTGEDSGHAVQTFEKAKELLLQCYENDSKAYNIYISGAVIVNGNETWSLPESQFPWHPEVMRYEYWTDDMSSPAFTDWHVYGMIHVGGTLTLENITLDGNKNVECRYSIIQCRGNLNINDGAVITGSNKVKTLAGGGYDTGAGAITSSSNMSRIVVNGGSINNNYASKGCGGIAVNSGSFILNRGSIEYNVSDSSSYGGGIDATPAFDGDGEIIINGGNISHNQTLGRGGGIRASSIGTFAIKGGSISYNEAQNGGGISSDARGKLEVSGGEISHNKARENGGGIESIVQSYGHYQYFEIELTGGIISYNEAEKKGGGIYRKEGNILLNGTEISYNQADMGGGAYVEELSVDDTYIFKLKDGNIFGNTAISKGGGIFWGTGRNISFSGGTIRDNEAPDGEGMFLGRESTSLSTYPMPYGPGVFGGSQVKQNIKLGDDTVYGKLLPIRLTSAPADPDNHFNLAVEGSAYARNGAIAVEPDGDNVTNAAQYLMNFSLNDASGYTLVKNGDNIILGQAYFVDGVNGSDSNSGATPDNAFKTVSHAISVLGYQAGAIYICGTVSVPSSGMAGASSQVTWTLQANQSIIRYSGESAGGRTYEPFTGNMIEVNDGAELTLNNVSVYGALGQESMGGNGYLIIQGGVLKVSPDTSLEYGTVYLKDGKEITVTGDAPALLMEVEKENARGGDVIGHYTDAGTGFAKEENFRLSEEMALFSLHKRDADTIVLGAVSKVYVDGQNGNDGNDGTTPATAFLTMEKAYQTLQATGGQIYIVDTVKFTDDTKLGVLHYQDASGAIAMTGRVQVIRYEMNSNPLFLVSDHTLTLSGICLDGAGAAAAGNTSALVKVGTDGTLKVQDHAMLQNNQTSGNGGAVENEGKTELYQCSFQRNQAAKGAAVYQNGSLLVNSSEISWSESGAEAEELYFCSGKYVDIGKLLPADMELRINMDPGDTAEGRVIAEFAEDAYEETGVIRETEHFWINPAATERKLAPSGRSTLVLAGDFAVSLTGTEFFQKIGNTISFNSIFTNAGPQDVTLEVTKHGVTVPVDIRDYNRFKKITIPVSRETIGELELVFHYGSAVVTLQVVLSGYEVVYASGQDSLVAEAQKDSLTGIHTDTAKIRIYNGASVPKEFKAEERSIRYEDRASVEIDNSRISRDMEPDLAMRYFGLDMGRTLQIPGNGIADAAVILSNGDLLTADKAGKIILDNASLGDCSSNIELDYETKSTVRVQVQVRKDDTAVNDAAVTLKDAAGHVTELVYRTTEPVNLTEAAVPGLFHSGSSRQNVFPYTVTGIAPGTYRIYVNGVDTRKSITARAGIPVQEEIDLYSIHYQLKGGKFKETAPEYYVSGVGVNALPQPTFSGYIFGGWYKNAAYTGSVTAGISKTAAEPYVLYAKWEKEQAKPKFKVRLQQREFFEKLGSSIEIRAQLLNAKAENVSVKVQMLGKDGKVKENVQAKASGSGGVKKVTVTLGKESVGTLLLTFQSGKVKVQERVELSGYEVVYREGRDSLLAKAQKDEKSEIHKDTAGVTVYNGGLDRKSFSIGGYEITYADKSPVTIDNDKISKNMKAEHAMRYFGLKVNSFFSIEAGGSGTVKVILSNGDMLTADKKGEILLTDTVLGGCRTNVELNLETQAITRVQVRVREDDKPVNKGAVILQGQNGKTVTLSQKRENETDGIYLKTGLSTEKSSIVVNDVDTGRMIQAIRGKVVKKNINFYSIRYELNKGTEKDLLAAYYVQGVGVRLADPVRKGYTFEGWYRTKDFSNEAVTEISKEDSGSMKFYAKWREELKLAARTSVPKTGDGNIIAIDVALMGGMGYLMKMFTGVDFGIDEEKKELMLKMMIGKAKGKSLLVRLGTIVLIAVSLLLYYTVGMKKAVRRDKRLQRQQNI